MAAKDSEEFTQRCDAGDCRLTEAQIKEVERIKCDFREGRTLLATKEQMEELWQSCGL